jgi:hypothetical protein
MINYIDFSVSLVGNMHAYYYPGFQSLHDISIYYLLSKALESRVAYYM